MECISPIQIKSSDKTEGAVVRNFVPCGKCNFCLERKRGDWSFRIAIEFDNAESAHFITLTYDDQHTVLSSDWTGMYRETVGLPELSKRDVQLFMKRLRKENALYSQTSLRYYLAGEYGTKTQRPHYHLILFNLDRRVIDGRVNVDTGEFIDVTTIWGKGQLDFGGVTPASIHYTTKYVINRVSDYGARERPFSLMSTKPGLGSTYLETHWKYHRDGMRTYVMINGVKARLPRYYKDRLFTPVEKQRLAGFNSDYEIRRDALIYWDEVEALVPHHPDPVSYQRERIVFAHDVFIESINKNDTF